MPHRDISDNLLFLGQRGFWGLSLGQNIDYKMNWWHQSGKWKKSSWQSRSGLRESWEEIEERVEEMWKNNKFRKSKSVFRFFISLMFDLILEIIKNQFFQSHNLKWFLYATCITAIHGFIPTKRDNYSLRLKFNIQYVRSIDWM